MYVSVEVPVESTLKGSEAKLLLHLLRHQDEIETTAQMMRGSGVTDKQTFYAARAKLRDLGLLDNPGRIFQLGRESQGGKADQSGNPASRESQPVGKSDRGNPTPRFHATVEGTVVHQEEKTFRQRAMEADLMDDSGDWRVPDAPCNLRRAEQIKVLSQAWAQAFPDDRPLIVPNAKRLLVLAGNSAEDVLDHIEEVQASPKQITYPFAYIQGYYQRQQQAAPQVKAVEIGKPARDEAGEYMMSEPSERSKMLQERLAARGMLRRDEDDD